MFKFKSYNLEKAEGKNEKEKSKSSSSTGTLKKSSSETKSSSYVSSKTKTKPSAEEIKAINNKQSPQYTKKNTVTDWHKNKTYSAKNETKKVVIPSPHKKLERK